MKPKIYILMGEAGSGKDFLLRNLIQQYPDLFNEIISYTTRPKRENEIDGISYHFITKNEFLSMNMMEATIFNDWYYGIGLNCLVSDKINLAVLNPAGVRTFVSNSQVDTTVFRIMTTLPKTRIIRQLSRENFPDIDEIFRRYKADEEDFKDLEFFFHPLLNDNYLHLYYNTEIIAARAKAELGQKKIID
jgi:guanylate kinase